MSVRRGTALSLASSFVALALIVSVGAAAAQEAAGPSLLSDARAGHTATLLADERVLVAGGVDGETELATAEVIDPASATVASLGALAQARSGHTATLLPDGRMLIAGGHAEGSSLAAAELFDPDTGTSAPAPAMKWARTGHAAALLDDGRVLLVGGTDDGKPVARAELFDPASGSFTPTAKSRAVHRDATATVLPFGKVLVAGTATKKKAPAAELYDPVKDKWTAVKKAPRVTGHVAAKLRDGRVLLAGGPGEKSQLFDLAKGKFAQAPAVAAKRTGHTATPLLFGEVLIVGGDQNGEEVAAVELFDIETDSFETIGELMIPRTGHTTTALAEGGALIVGGTWAGLALDGILVYDPDTRELEPLGGVTALAEPAADARSKDQVLAELGAPDAFLILYPDRSADVATEPVSLETWTWYDTGAELTFEGDTLVSEESVEPVDEFTATPYEPASFEAYMSLDEVIDSAGVEDYFGGPMDDAGSTELYFGRQLAWGLKDGALHFIEGIALGAEAASEEVE